MHLAPNLIRNFHNNPIWYYGKGGHHKIHCVSYRLCLWYQKEVSTPIVAIRIQLAWRSVWSRRWYIQHWNIWQKVKILQDCEKQNQIMMMANPHICFNNNEAACVQKIQPKGPNLHWLYHLRKYHCYINKTKWAFSISVGKSNW